MKLIDKLFKTTNEENGKKETRKEEINKQERKERDRNRYMIDRDRQTDIGRWEEEGGREKGRKEGRARKDHAYFHELPD